MVNYEELDDNIVSLVKVLNRFPGIETIGSCGGHEDPKAGGWPAGTFYVRLRMDRSEAGWLSLEFLAWAVNNDYRRAGHGVAFMPVAPPPYLNSPGEVLSWVVEGEEEDPEELAKFLGRVLDEVYVSVEDLRDE